MWQEWKTVHVQDNRTYVERLEPHAAHCMRLVPITFLPSSRSRKVEFTVVDFKRTPPLRKDLALVRCVSLTTLMQRYATWLGLVEQLFRRCDHGSRLPKSASSLLLQPRNSPGATCMDRRKLSLEAGSLDLPSRSFLAGSHEFP